MNTYTKKHLRDNIELSYTKDGDIEILISPGFGAGWSTWDSNSINLAVDKKIIDFFKKYGKYVSLDKLKTFLESIGYEGVYCGGWKNIVIEKIKPNCKFRIDEYDGSEELISYEDDHLWEL